MGQPFRYSRMVFRSSGCIFLLATKTPLGSSKYPHTTTDYTSSHPALVYPHLLKLFSADLNNIFTKVELSTDQLWDFFKLWFPHLLIVTIRQSTCSNKAPARSKILQISGDQRELEIFSTNQLLLPGYHPICLYETKDCRNVLKIHHHFHPTTVNSSLWVKWKKKIWEGKVDIKIGFNEVLSQQLLEA